MKVAVYHPWVYLKGGAERTLLELTRRSQHDWTIFTNHYEPEHTFPEFRDSQLVELSRVPVQRTLLGAGRAALQALTQLLPLQGYDALMVSSEGVGNLVTLRTQRIPIFCFCHTPLKIAYDPFTRDRFYTHQRPGRLMRAAIASYVQVDRFGWRRYERVFANSREVASRLLKAGLVAPERLEVIHPGVDLDQFGPAPETEPFFLLAGRIARVKNLELAVDAFRAFKRKRPHARAFRLVIAGMLDEKSRSYFSEMFERCGRERDVEWVLNPTDQELQDLYGRCTATLFTPLNEDWGIAVLEAMASAKPVIAVRRGGPLESIVDQHTGLLCDADPAAFERAMATLAARPDLAEAMGRRAREHVARFTWTPFVERIDEFVDYLVGGEPVARRVLAEPVSVPTR